MEFLYCNACSFFFRTLSAVQSFPHWPVCWSGIQCLVCLQLWLSQEWQILLDSEQKICRWKAVKKDQLHTQHAVTDKPHPLKCNSRVLQPRNQTDPGRHHRQNVLWEVLLCCWSVDLMTIIQQKSNNSFF